LKDIPKQEARSKYEEEREGKKCKEAPKNCKKNMWLWRKVTEMNN